MRRFLVIGAGGREHALVWKLNQDPVGPQIYAAPGNPGISTLASCLPVPPNDLAALASMAEALAIDLTVVGPEAPLASGIVDVFRAWGLRIFGPVRAAAELEASKVFAKRLMQRHGIPTAPFEVFERADEAIGYVRRANRPLVVKADGLAAGKGVVVASDPQDAEAAVIDMMVWGAHGAAGDRVVIEERLEGREVSVLAFVSGRRVFPLLPAQDYKRAHDGNRGLNTGGMGAIAPAPLSLEMVERVVNEILEPVAAAMVAEGRPYTGVLYAGVMVTADGPQVLEFNCRFGDPEAQVILPLLDGDLAEVMIDVLDGRAPELRWRNGSAACVVLASRGYPGSFEPGIPIQGLDDVPDDVLVFHAGTRGQGDAIVTAGGRVLNVVGTGSTLDEAAGRAYAGAARVSFEGKHFRTDIGSRKVLTAVGEGVS